VSTGKGVQVRHAYMDGQPNNAKLLAILYIYIYYYVYILYITRYDILHESINNIDDARVQTADLLCKLLNIRDSRDLFLQISLVKN